MGNENNRSRRTQTALKNICVHPLDISYMKIIAALGTIAVIAVWIMLPVEIAPKFNQDPDQQPNSIDKHNLCQQHPVECQQYLESKRNG